MKRILNKKPKIIVAPGMYLYLAILILLIPLRWLLGAIISITVHELFHILSILCCGIQIDSVSIGINGVRIRTGRMSHVQELLCALAGPFGGALLLLLARWFPVTALCAGFHTVYNLLPIYPQDGGRALRCGARILLPEEIANRLCSAVEYVCIAGVGLLGIYGTFVLNAGILPLFFALVSLWRSSPMKNSLQRD